MATAKLTQKQSAFIAEYLIDLNGAAAARRAGYSRHTAKAIALKLMKTEAIRQAIHSAMEERAKRTSLTADLVINNILRVRNLAEADAEYHAALKGDELLGRHLKLFTDRVELEAGEGLAERLGKGLERARKRA